MQNGEVIVIGISGASASGKSLLASTIVDELGSEKVVVISEDSYYKDQSHLPLDIRERTNFDHPNAFDHDLLIKHLTDLKRGVPIEVPTYNYSTHTRNAETIIVGLNSNIIVLEGILLFSDERLRDAMDIRIYMDTPLDLCILRRIRRDLVERGRSIDSVLEQYQQTVRPMFLKFIEPCKKHADLIVPKGGKNRVAIELIKAKMKDLLQNGAHE